MNEKKSNGKQLKCGNEYVQNVVKEISAKHFYGLDIKKCIIKLYTTIYTRLSCNSKFDFIYSQKRKLKNDKSP